MKEDKIIPLTDKEQKICAEELNTLQMEIDFQTEQKKTWFFCEQENIYLQSTWKRLKSLYVRWKIQNSAVIGSTLATAKNEK